MKRERRISRSTAADILFSTLKKVSFEGRIFLAGSTLTATRRPRDIDVRLALSPKDNPDLISACIDSLDPENGLDILIEDPKNLAEQARFGEVQEIKFL